MIRQIWRRELQFTYNLYNFFHRCSIPSGAVESITYETKVNPTNNLAVHYHRSYFYYGDLDGGRIFLLNHIS